MITGIEVPLEAAMAVAVAALAVGAFTERRCARRRVAAAVDPLSRLFAPAALEHAIEQATRHAPERINAKAVLHGRIDQLAALRAGWNAATREQVLSQISGVMKAGIRRSDRFTAPGGESFTIIMSDADERTARGVAERLRRALAELRLAPFGTDTPFTASFGVAAVEMRNSGENLVARARAALEAAQQRGADHIVAASEIEEIICLPAPDPSAHAA